MSDDERTRGFRMKYAGEELAVISIPVEASELPAELTAAERDVCVLVLAGLSTASIAAHRGASTSTIANQLASIFRKLGVSSRGELAVRLGRRC
jgi:DNA-binding CsgD family transcriptional regulator